MIRAFLFALVLSTPALACADWFLTPAIGAGYNSVQQSYFRIGLDLGIRWDENIYFGVGAYYAFGSHPNDDREIGGGPFVGYHLPVFSFLSAEFREDVYYVDERNPVLVQGPPDYYTHTNLYGVESGTYAGLTLRFSENVAVSGGYRLAVGLTNSSIANGRSGTLLGITIGI